MHIGGGLSRLRTGIAHRAPGRDPGGDREPGGRHERDLPGHAARPPHAPSVGHAARRASRSRRPPARRWPTPSCAATSATPPRTIRAKRAAVVAELPDWEELRRRRRGDQGRHDGPPARAPGAARGAASPPAAASCTGPATPTRPTAIVTDLVRATGADEVVKVKSMATQEIGLNEALEAAGHRRRRDRPRRADRAARPRQALAHPGAGDPPQPRRDPGDLPARDARTSTPALTDEPRRLADGRPGAPAAQVPARQGRRSPAPTSRIAETGTLRRGRVRGQRPDVPDPAARR